MRMNSTSGGIFTHSQRLIALRRRLRAHDLRVRQRAMDQPIRHARIARVDDRPLAFDEHEVRVLRALDHELLGRTAR